MDLISFLENDKPLTNTQIDNYYGDTPNYKGCIFKNDLGSNDALGSGDFYILNLGNVKNGGTHWTLLIRPSRNMLCYFDSYGVRPSRDIFEYAMALNLNNFEYNTEDIQDINTNRCGFYCMYVADNIINGRRFPNVVNDFSRDPGDDNVRIIKEHFENKW